VEALKVLRATLAGGADRSLGIVTFNAEQQALIENMLDEARRDDPALEPFFAEERAEPVLVKNLESVQGEERDVMLFSLTYGPDATGRVAMNFGPLNQSGGERRLNVAVTRAREALLVFASLRPDQIDLSRTSATGVAHLKRFLSFAQLGARAFATVPTAPLGDVESPFEAAVAERLRGKGWVLHPQVGVSGFRVDLGVVDPDRPGAYLAGVECDGATYHRGATARDRDRLRQAVLEGLGWHVLRIWSTDWWTGAARETERLHEQLTARLHQQRARRAEEDAQVVATADPPAAAEGEAVPADAATLADAGRFYDEEYRDILSSIVGAEITAYGPLRRDQLVLRVARAHGFQRTGREIQERIEAAIPLSLRQTTDSAGTFIWPTEHDPAAARSFRAQNGERRDPAEVPIEQLRALAVECGAVLQEEAELLIAMRNACGLQKMSSAVRARLLEALGPPEA
jgi:very-short-patch-repair endonuclease